MLVWYLNIFKKNQLHPWGCRTLVMGDYIFWLITSINNPTVTSLVKGKTWQIGSFHFIIPLIDSAVKMLICWELKAGQSSTVDSFINDQVILDGCFFSLHQAGISKVQLPQKRISLLLWQWKFIPIHFLKCPMGIHLYFWVWKEK